MQDLLTGLNDAQRQAVTDFRGASLIIAGAGSGKTRVLTSRIAYMLEQGVDPHSILALTFTNKAAAEMRQRIEQIVGSSARYIRMGTFHSVFARILARERELLGYPQDLYHIRSPRCQETSSRQSKELQPARREVQGRGQIASRHINVQNCLWSHRALPSPNTIYAGRKTGSSQRPETGKQYTISTASAQAQRPARTRRSAVADEHPCLRDSRSHGAATKQFVRVY